MACLHGFNLLGGEITSTSQPSFSACCSWCQSYSGYKGFTWGLPTAGSNINICFLKNINCTISHNSSHISNRNQQTSSNMPEPNEDQDPISTEVTEYTSAAYTPSEEAKDEEHK
ncbi:unnamed protein product [Rotaria socialis]|uniref:Uncharacterized protein n=1 Tax=Rotaria socialis TaxID=392032 RepID=A0A818CFN3_9BILA|nr:unnamed protein product [Rotaria socialis]